MNPRLRVAVTGLGCISPLGNTVAQSWAGVIAGRSGAGPITRFDASEHKTRFAAEVKGFDAAGLLGPREARKMDLFTQYAVVAAEEALAQSGLEVGPGNRDRVGVLVGTGIGGLTTILQMHDTLRDRGPDRVSPFLIPMMIADSAAGMIAIRIGARGPNLAAASACATGTNTIGEAAEMIRRGSADAMLAGSSEAAIVNLTMAGLNAMTALSTRNEAPERASRPFEKDRDGFVMGEGAGVLVLEEWESARARDAQILCELSGYGTSDDAYHITAPAENGAGAAMCMAAALRDGSLRPAEIEYINAHGTSTRLNDASETAAVRTVFGEHARQVPISSTKSMTGHLMGASGSVEAVFCVKAITDGVVPPTINYETPDPACDLDYVPNVARYLRPRHVMSNSFGFGGHNATVIFSRAD